MTGNRTLILLSCSHHKATGGAMGKLSGRSFSQTLPKALQSQVLAKRNEICRMLSGGPPRLYNEDQKSGYRDERLPNRQLRNGGEFGGSDPAPYLPAYQRYTGRFFGHLISDAPSFWKELPDNVEILFASALHGLVFWDEPIQDYDCHFSDYTDESRPRKVRDIWGYTPTDTFREFLRIHSTSNRTTTVYDLLSESLYQTLFDWEMIQGPTVYHRIFKGVSGPDVLTRLTRILALDMTGFAQGTYRSGWYTLPDGDEDVEFGFELKIGQDPVATREGDIERIRSRLFEEKPWIKQLSEPLRETLVQAEVTWRKVENHTGIAWGGIAVSFIKPVERILKDILNLSGKETLGDLVPYIWRDPQWQPVKKELKKLNDLYVNAKHLKNLDTPITQNDVAIARKRTFDVLSFVIARSRPQLS